MLETLRNKIDQLLGKPATDRLEKSSLHESIWVLLYSLLLCDDEVTDSELTKIRSIFIEKFEVKPEQMEDLIQQVHVKAEQNTCYHEELQTIRDNCDTDQRVEILDLFWQLAYADGHLSPDEEHMIRRVADLLHIRHENFISTKLKHSANLGREACDKDV